MSSMHIQVSDTDSHHWPDSPFTQQITFCFLYCFSCLWAFCQAVLLLTYVVAFKIWSCHELDSWRFVHIQGLTAANFLTICLMIVATLAIFQVWVRVGVYPGWSGTGRCCDTCIQYCLASVVFKQYKKVVLKLQQPMWYHPLISSFAKGHFSLTCSFYQSTAQSSGTSLHFPLYNPTATLLYCMQMEGNAACC